MRRRQADTRACLWRRAATLALLAALAPAVAGAGGNAPGSYCPIPEPGQKPDCRDGAEQRYSAFYRSLEEGNLDPAAAASVEADLAAGGEAERTYEALSSMAYGYYVLARKAAASPKADPVLVARLERWNDALARAYRDTPPDTSLRAAVREAAVDIEHRAAPVELTCPDTEGRPARCTSTQAVIRGMDDARDHTGLRGQLGRLMERLLGPGGI